MQNVNTMIRRSVPIGAAAAGGLLAFAAGAVIAVSVPAVVTGVSLTINSSAPASTSALGAQQIAHDRSEQGLGSGPSVGGQLIAHDRSESGLEK